MRRRRPIGCSLRPTRRSRRTGPGPRPAWPSRPRPPKRRRASSSRGPTSRSPPSWTGRGTRPRSCSAQAREQCQAMVDEAQGLRARVLADLSQAPEGAPRPDRTAACRSRAIGRDGPGRPPLRRHDRRGAVRGRGQRPAGRRGGRPSGGGTTRRGHARGSGRAAVGRGGRGGGVERRRAPASEPEASRSGPASRGESDTGSGGRGRPRAPAPALDKAGDESPVDALFAKIRAAHEEEAEPEPEPPPSGDEPGAGLRRPTPRWTPHEADEPPGQEACRRRRPTRTDRPEDRNPLAVRRDELIARS